MPTQQMLLNFVPERRILTVGELTREIATVLDREFSDVWVSGEISGTKVSANHHIYFTLKDEQAQIQCACFRAAARLLKFRPQDGLAVLVRGRVEVYEPRGQYQLIVETIEPQGYGALQLAFEQLKKRLEAEGLFARERKRPLPRFPRRVGLITSPTGAVIRDMLNILERRFSGLHLRLYPVLVQGEGSVEQVCAALRYFSDNDWADVVVLARGGGSIEDLWTFNEEAVARAIAACRVPVISAIGHETDFTIADFVADLRAPTPSAAAELLITQKSELLERIASHLQRLTQSIRLRLSELERQLSQRGVEQARSLLERRIRRHQIALDELGERLRQAIRQLLTTQRLRLESLEQRLRLLDLRVRLARAHARLDAAYTAVCRAIANGIQQRRAAVELLASQAHQLSPAAVLERGYALVEKDGAILRDAAQTCQGETLGVRLARGQLRVKVTQTLPSPTAPGGSLELP